MNKILLTIAMTFSVFALGFALKGNSLSFGGVPQVPSYNNVGGTASSTNYLIGDDISTKVVDARGGRGYASFCNYGPNPAYLSFSATSITATSSSGVAIASKTCYVIDQDNLFTGEIEAITESATTTYLQVTEFIGY